MRLVSTSCSNTEIVCALGCGGFLVGVDSDSDYPQEILASLPRVGRDLDIDIESVAALNPDLVLASLTVPGHEKVVAGLQSAGLDCLSPSPLSLEDVYRDIRDIAARLGVGERGEELIRDMHQAIVRAAAGAFSSKGQRILIQWWPKPVMAPGERSWCHDLIEAVGGSNAASGHDRACVELSDEDVAELNPDAIVISWCGVEPIKYRPKVLYENPAWGQLKCIVERKVFCIPECYLGRPGPRLAGGAQQLARVLSALRLWQ